MATGSQGKHHAGNSHEDGMTTAGLSRKGHQMNDRCDRECSYRQCVNEMDRAICRYERLVDGKVKDAVSELRRRFCGWGGALSVIVLLSGFLGLPQLRDYVLNQASVLYVEKKVASQVEELRLQVCAFSNLYDKASHDLYLLRLEIDAESGCMDAYCQLERHAAESPFARKLYDTVTQRQLLRLTNYTQHHCMNEMGLGYNRNSTSSERELFAVVLNPDSNSDQFNDAIKNIADRHENGEYLDFFVWYACHANDLNRLRLAVDCMRYCSDFPKTMAKEDIRRWWEVHKSEKYCHGMTAMTNCLGTVAVDCKLDSAN